MLHGSHDETVLHDLLNDKTLISQRVRGSNDIAICDWNIDLGPGMEGADQEDEWK